MTETIHYVTVQVAAPRNGSLGMVEEGFYKIISGNTVELVTATGKPRLTKGGKPIKQLIAHGETARQVAWRLTKENAPNRRPRFNGPLPYFDLGKF